MRAATVEILPLAMMLLVGCGGVVSPARPEISTFRARVGLGDIVPIRTGWLGACREVTILDNLDYPWPRDEVSCEYEEYSAHYTCDPPCAGELVPTELGPLRVRVELRAGERRYVRTLSFEVVDPDPGSLVVSCGTQDLGGVFCSDPRATRLDVWASVDGLEYDVQHMVVDGAARGVSEGLPITSRGWTLELGAERLRLDDPATYPDKYAPRRR